MDKYPKYISQEQQEIFERFLFNQMTLEEKNLFLEKINNSPILKQQFDSFKIQFESVEESFIREKMNGFHELVVNAQKETKVFQLKPFYKYAAVAVLLVTLGGTWFFNSKTSNEALFEEFFTPDPGLPTVMGNNDNYDFYEAMVDYKQGNYDLAISKWEKQLMRKPENDTLNYFLGSAYLAQEKPKKALDYFVKNSKIRNSVFEEDRLYYQALTQLKLKNIEEAKTLLSLSKKANSKKLLLELNQ